MDPVDLVHEQVMMIVRLLGHRPSQAEEVEQEIVDAVRRGNRVQADDAGVRRVGPVGLVLALLVGLGLDRQLRSDCRNCSLRFSKRATSQTSGGAKSWR